MKNREQTTAVVTRLERYHATDRQRQFARLRRWVEDPLRPTTYNGGLRVNPIVVLLILIALLAGGTFLFFSLVHL